MGANDGMADAAVSFAAMTPKRVELECQTSDLTAMRYILAVACLLVSSDAEAAAPREIINDLRHSDIVQTHRSVTDMPKGLRESLRTLFRQRSLHIADSHHPFRETDVVTDATRGLPTRRLALAFATNRFYYVYYRAGGYQSAGKVMVFDRSRGYAFIWGGAEFADDPPTPQRVIRRILSDSFDDDTRIIW